LTADAATRILCGYYNPASEGTMSDSFTLTTYVPASPLQVYTAWLDGEQHSEMTGGRAHCEPVVGAAFDAWEGYIRGTNLELEPGRRILQSWRSTEFPDDAPDSRVELTLQPDANGTTILLRHWDIPPGQGSNYEKGWHEHYFSPMRQFFEKQTNTQVVSADRATPAPAAPEWERPVGEDDVDDWSSDSSSDAQDVGWEAPVVEEVDEPESAPEKPQPISLQAERPFLDAPTPKAEEKPKPKKKAARKKPAAKKAAKKPAKKKAASKMKPAKKKAAKKSTKKAAKKKPAKKVARKAAKKKPAKKAAKKPAKKKPAKKKATKKKAGAKKKPARKAAKKKTGKKPAKKSAKKPARKKASRKRR
jgi:uncharacterized protein YndB with AHSA1/START domain